MLLVLVTKHVYSYLLKILPPKNENLQIKILHISDQNRCDIRHISSHNVDCEYLLEPPWRGDSNEYPQSMFPSKNKKINVLLCKP